MKSIWQILYALVSALVFVAILFEQANLYLVVKPLLIFTLLLHFISSSKGYPNWRNMVIFALLFSWAGDVLLLWNHLFLAGLGLFLIAHVFYILAYQKTGAAKGTSRRSSTYMLATLGAVLISVLFPHLGSLLVPVVIYAMVLLVMALRAQQRRGATSAVSFKLVSIGAILFVISDGILAINKFAYAIPGDQILVMSTYIAAQYLIVQGLLKHEDG